MAAVTRWRTWRLAAILFAIFIQVVNGYEEIYTISQLSPRSASNAPEDAVLQTSSTDSLSFSIEPSISYGKEESDQEDDKEDSHHMVERSADFLRESRSINMEDVPNSNNEIDNELEVHNKRKYYDIHPTKTLDYLHSEELMLSSGFGDRLEFRFPGEGNRVPYGRALPAGPIRPSAVQPIFATATHRNEPRQNTEIQNIITGIVKLLNGNVNVQANTQLLRPGRPMASRINNRGPPRISDVPPLHDFEKPIHGMIPTKIPPPYPFERPPVHVNLPEQIVPPLHKPGLHRPIPPWQRPRPRPPSRRPNPGLPMYKPNIPIIPDFESESHEVTANENETVHSENTLHHEDDAPPEVTTIEVERSTSTTEATSTTTTEATTTTEKATAKTTTEEATQKTTTEKVTEKTTTEKPKTEKPPKPEKKKETEKNKHKLEDKTQRVTEKVEDKTTSKPEKIDIKEDSTQKTVIKEVTTKLNDIKEVTTKKNDITDVVQDIIKEVKPPNNAIEQNITLNDTKNETIELQSSIIETRTPELLTPTPTEGLITHAPTFVESTVAIESSTINSQPLPTSQGIPYQPYRPRPGIVLDDPEFKRGNSRRRTEVGLVTAPPPGYGEIFDVTVSAIQGPGGKGGASVHIESVNPLSPEDDIIVSASGQQGFVSIDGKRTYLNLFDTSTVAPTRVHTHSAEHTVPPLPPPPLAPQGVGQGVAIPEANDPPPVRRPQPTLHRPPGYRRPQPTVRIDTCIVGDDSTCDKAQNEKCRTEAGISSCQCRPGFARRIQRDPCRRVVALVLNLRVDRLYDRKVAWDAKLADKESDPYQQLSYEAVRAIDSAFSMTPFSDDFVSGSVNTIHKGDENNHGVFVNYTILMQETAETTRQSIATDIQKHILGVIRRRSNNVGASALWLDSVVGSVLPLNDVDECSSPDLNDCHKLATCTNTWGGFRCTCPATTLDESTGGASLSGRICIACPPSTCSDRGVCHYVNAQPYCSCNSGYYGSKCEVDGEVVGVAVGASLAAALVIALTLAALLSWSRKWSREQKAVGMGSPVFNYMAANTIKTPPVGQPPYQVTLEERMRWAQIAEAMVQSNHYASEAQTMATRPSSAMFGGYPTLPPVPLPRMGLHGGQYNGTLNTVTSRGNSASHHNLYGYTNHMATDSTSSEASSHAPDRTDLLVPRPKSRSRSMHNQTGIYYDVDYENAPEPIYGSKGIPLSTYTVSRGPPFYR